LIIEDPVTGQPSSLLHFLADEVASMAAAISRRTLSPMLILSTGLLVISAFNYGFSDQAFASCQAMDAFDRQFGFYNEKTHAWKLHPLFTSLYNSLKAGGQIIGAWFLNRSFACSWEC
jgi:hypothetical protein